MMRDNLANDYINVQFQLALLKNAYQKVNNGNRADGDCHQLNQAINEKRKELSEIMERGNHGGASNAR